jgi:hypothetical protein
MPRRAAKALLAAVFALSVYRAVTQSIVCDEAITFELYIAAPLRAMFEHFDANHHFLNTVLMRISTGFFGLSDLSMRLPALGGALLYLTAVNRVTGIAFGEGWISLLAVAGLTLNPLVMDFLGRGPRLWSGARTLDVGAGIIARSASISPNKAARPGAGRCGFGALGNGESGFRTARVGARRDGAGYFTAR